MTAEVLAEQPYPESNNRHREAVRRTEAVSDK